MAGMGSGDDSSVPIHCGECGLVFRVPREWAEKRKRDRTAVLCPNGCRIYLQGESVEDQLRAQVESLHQAQAQTQRDLEHAERSRAAMVGVCTKIKRRVARGECPCCGEAIAGLAEHMARHPQWAEHKEGTDDHR